MKAIGRRMFLYNTICEVVLYDVPEQNDTLKQAGEILNECEEISRGVQKMLNVFEEESELSQLNHNYRAGEWYGLSKELFSFLKEVLEFSKLSEGAYDPTVGRLMKLWDFRAKQPKIPPIEEIQAALSVTGYDKLLLDEDRQAICLEKEGMLLDAGGAGKGYALELVANCLCRWKVGCASLNYGGNLYVLGEGLKVGIQAPWKERGSSFGTVFLKNQAIATSAGYDRYFEIDKKKYQHILHPQTGYPVENNLLSVSIVSDSPLISDLLSTAFFVAGTEKGEKIAKKLRERGREAEYVLVEEEGVRASEGLKTFDISKEE